MIRGTSPDRDLVWWLLVAYVTLLPVQFKTQLGDGLKLAPSDLLIYPLLILSLRRIQLRKRSWSVWHAVLLSSFAVATGVADIHQGFVSRYAWLQKDFGLLSLFLVYLITTSVITSWEHAKRLAQWFVASVSVLNVISLAAFALLQFTGLRLSWVNYGTSRVSGLMVDPNAYGGLVLTALLIRITFPHGSSVRTRLQGITADLLLTLGLLLTFSRSSWIGLAAAVVLGLVISPKHAIRLAALGVMSFVPAYMLYGSQLLAVLEIMALRSTQVGTRLDFLRKGIELFTQYPVLGAGLGTFYDRYVAIIHNTPVWFLAEFGTLGFTAFLGFSTWFGGKALREFRMTHNPLALGLLLAHAAMLGLSIGIEAFYQRHWWLVLALIAAPPGPRATVEEHRDHHLVARATA